MKLDKEVKAKWVKALRSGKYEQGREALMSEQFDENYNATGGWSFVVSELLM